MKRTLILAGRAIVIDELGQPLDRAFDRLFAAYSGNTSLPLEEFATAAVSYFDATLGGWVAHDKYFNTFTILSQSLLASGRFIEAEQLWELALRPALLWEELNPNQRVHKGTPYYFWGMTAILRGEMDHGYLLVHQGVDEDNKSFGAGAINAPGYALVSLNDDKPDQAFRAWVIKQGLFVDGGIADYNATHTRALTIDDVKRRFFQAPPSTETVFLLTHTLARLMRLHELPTYTTQNPFAGQLELNLLFDIALVIDATIKAKNSADNKFIKHAEYLLTTAGHALNAQQLGDINVRFNSNFDVTLTAALDGVLTLPGTALDRLQCDVALAYGLRNNGAHNTGTVAIVWNRFPEVQRALLRVFFAAIDYLY